jgi:hypothetical protein
VIKKRKIVKKPSVEVKDLTAVLAYTREELGKVRAMSVKCGVANHIGLKAELDHALEELIKARAMIADRDDVGDFLRGMQGRLETQLAHVRNELKEAEGTIIYWKNLAEEYHRSAVTSADEIVRLRGLLNDIDAARPFGTGDVGPIHWTHTIDKIIEETHRGY